jgi:hypothetical protein
MHISLTKIGGLTIGKWVSNKKYIWFLGRPKCQKKKVIFNKTYFLKIRDGKGLKI